MAQNLNAPSSRNGAVGLGVVASLTISVASFALAAERASPADTARFLAGIAPAETSPLRDLARFRSWQSHSRSLNNGWRVLDKRQLSKIRAWSVENLKKPGKTLFYMFSGPDYLYANSFFPSASTYVFAGLEPVGTEPNLTNMSSGVRAVGLSRLRASMNSVLHLSFFITKKMKTNLGGAGFKGTVPILYVFLARAGKTVEALEYVKLNKDGTLKTLAPENARMATGVKITFSDTAGSGTKGSELVGDKRTLYYFSTDISDGGLKRSGFLNFLRTLGTGDALVKSATYLMHYSNFSKIRNFLLEHCRRIVQDDSGIALRYFKKADWKFKPYGRYTGPISMFAKRYQSGMARLFRSRVRKNIDFGIGYKWRRGASNLLVAEKINVGGAAALPAQTAPAQAKMDAHEKATAVD